MDAHPGLYHDVQTYLRERIDEVLAGAAEPIVVRIEGADLTTLRKRGRPRRGVAVRHRRARRPARRARRRRAGDRGPRDARRRRALRPQAGRHPPRRGDARRPARRSATSSTARAPTTCTSGASPATRHSLSDIRNLPIDTPGGGTVRLGEVASVRVRPTPNVIHRQDGSRRIDIAANVSDRSLSEIAHDVRDKLDDDHLPDGLPRRAHGRGRRAGGRVQTACSSSASRRRSGSCCCCRRRSATCAWRCSSS